MTLSTSRLLVFSIAGLLCLSFAGNTFAQDRTQSGTGMSGVAAGGAAGSETDSMKAPRRDPHSGTTIVPNSGQSVRAPGVAEQPSGIGEQGSGQTQSTIDRSAGAASSENVQGTSERARRDQMQRSHGDTAHLPTGLIGVSLRVVADRIGEPASLYVGHVHPEGPAQQAGLKHGDEVVTVNGATVTGKTYEQVIQMVRGEAGTEVKLGVKRDGGVQEIAITRIAGEKLYKG
jgi:S1-C subfamily serine protease